MARVTVEDCIVQIPNRFELVMVAAQRGREIAAGAPLTLDRDNDKNPVVALREVADKTVSIEELGESLIRERQRHVEMDDAEDDIIDLMAGEEEFLQQSLAADAAGNVAPETEETAVETEASEPEVSENEVSEDEVDLLLAAVEGQIDDGPEAVGPEAGGEEVRTDAGDGNETDPAKDDRA